MMSFSVVENCGSERMLWTTILATFPLSLICANLTPTEDKFLNQQLVDYFSDDSSEEMSEEVIAAGNQKREAVEVAIEHLTAIFTPVNETRANHYWTRKRGRDQPTTTPQSAWELYFNLYPAMRPITPAPANSLYGNVRRKRRQAVDPDEANNNKTEERQWKNRRGGRRGPKDDGFRLRTKL